MEIVSKIIEIKEHNRFFKGALRSRDEEIVDDGDDEHDERGKDERIEWPSIDGTEIAWQLRISIEIHLRLVESEEDTSDHCFLS